MSQAVPPSPVERIAGRSLAWIRSGLALSGVIAAVAGLLILVAPQKTAAVLAGIVAIYAIVVGISYLATAATGSSLGAGSRIWHVVLGIVFIIAGIFAFSNLSETIIGLATFAAIVLGATWIFEGIVALTTLRLSGTKVWTVAYAILSVVAGVVLIVSPLTSAALLWVFLGVSLLVMGIVQTVRALAFSRD